MSGITSDALSLPRELEFIGGMDWGHNEPGVLLWIACLPGSRLHVYREWKFTGLSDEEIARGWRERTKALRVKVRYVAGDPSMWIRDGRHVSRGQSRAESFIRAGMPLRKAENDRHAGWSRLHSLLRVPTDDDGNVIGEPLLTVDEECRYLRRSIPAAQSAKLDADDVNTRGDDHALDALRYACMSRPQPTVFMAAPTRLNPLLEAQLASVTRRPVLGVENVA